MWRLGFFLGPLIGAGVILLVGARGGFLVQLVGVVLAGALMARVPDPPAIFELGLTYLALEKEDAARERDHLLVMGESGGDPELERLLRKWLSAFEE